MSDQTASIPIAPPVLQRIGSALLLALLLIMILVPVAYVFYGSFRTGAPGAANAGFTIDNWRTAYLSPIYLSALGNTVLLGVVVAILSLVVGGALAWIVARTNTVARHQLAILIIIPLMISNLTTTLAWIALAAPNAGFINAYVRALTGVRTVFNIYSFGGIVLVHVLHYASFAFLGLFAALRSIDASLEEASYMLGVGPLRTSFRMTLPLIAPTIATSFLVIFVFVAENFSVPTLLGTPVGFQTLPSLIFFNMAITPAQPMLAAASGTMLLWVALAGTMLQRRISSRASRYVTVTGKGTSLRLVRLGAWRFATFAFVMLFLLLAVVLPYLALVLGSFMSFLTPNLRPSVFTLDNYRTLFVGDNLRPVINSLVLSVGGGLGLTIVYVLLCYALSRMRSTWGRVADYVTIIPTAIPALILGVGLIWTFVGMSAPIYGTMAILVIAYFLRNIGYGVRHANNAFNLVSGDLTEAARMTGASGLRAFWDISIPIMRPSILSLWTMLFVFIFMEVSATILLYTPATRTLPTVLWNYMGSGSQPQAFAVAVAQATLIFIILFISDRKFGTLRTTLER
jgi:iron(III) transport system permease protein